MAHGRAAPTRSFGEKASGFVEMAQRGVGAVMAVKGAYDTAKSLYSLSQAAAPYLSALSIL